MTNTSRKNKQTSIFGTIPKDSIFNPIPPYNLRNDCQVGQWKRGEDDFKGNSLEMAILQAHKFYGNLGDTKKTHWLQLWFIASPQEDKIPPNTVCCTYIKTRSLENLGGKLVELMTSEIDPGTGIFTASFEKTQGKMGAYYVLKWSFRDREGEEEQKQLDRIIEFINGNPTFLDTGKPKTLICVDGMTPEQINDLDPVIDALENDQEPPVNYRQLTGAASSNGKAKSNS
jgi:hypothetical protein